MSIRRPEGQKCKPQKSVDRSVHKYENAQQKRGYKCELHTRDLDVVKPRRSPWAQGFGERATAWAGAGCWLGQLFPRSPTMRTHVGWFHSVAAACDQCAARQPAAHSNHAAWLSLLGQTGSRASCLCIGRAAQNWSGGRFVLAAAYRVSPFALLSIAHAHAVKSSKALNYMLLSMGPAWAQLCMAHAWHALTFWPLHAAKTENQSILEITHLSTANPACTFLPPHSTHSWGEGCSNC